MASQPQLVTLGLLLKCWHSQGYPLCRQRQEHLRITSSSSSALSHAAPASSLAAMHEMT